MMNKEQAIQTLQENAQLLHFEHPYLGLEEAIGVVIEALSEHSIPSTLDDAAEKMYSMTTTPPAPIEVAAYYNAAQQKLRDAFKAGAEWLASQIK